MKSASSLGHENKLVLFKRWVGLTWLILKLQLFLSANIHMWFKIHCKWRKFHFNPGPSPWLMWGDVYFFFFICEMVLKSIPKEIYTHDSQCSLLRLEHGYAISTSKAYWKNREINVLSLVFSLDAPPSSGNRLASRKRKRSFHWEVCPNKSSL